MGSCLSSPAFHIPTAILILDDGGLQEFAEPVKVAEILRENVGFFVCDSDDMVFDDYACPLSSEDELQLDHLYFLLPDMKLQSPLEASEMATLAVIAGAAMQRRRSKHNQYSSKIVPLTEDSTNRHRSHRGGGEESGKEMDFPNTIYPAKNSRSVKKLKRVASSRKASASRKVWRSKLPTIPETFAY